MKTRRNTLIYEWLIFIKVIEKKSFSAAATEFDVAVGSVSKAVARLEHYLDAKLISRNAHKFEVTVSGEIAYHKALLLCETYNNLLVRLDSAGNEIRGVLRLSAPGVLCDNVISKWIMEYMDENPNATIHLLSREAGSFTSDSPEFDDLVIKSGHIESPDLVHKNLHPVPFGMFASPDYVRKEKEVKTPEDLNYHSILKLKHNSIKNPLLLNLAGKTHPFSVTPEREFISNNLNVLICMALEGRGICIAAPYWMTERYIRQGRLIPVLPEWSFPTLPAYMVWRYRRRYSPLFTSFSHFIEKKWNAHFPENSEAQRNSQSDQ